MTAWCPNCKSAFFPKVGDPRRLCEACQEVSDGATALADAINDALEADGFALRFTVEQVRAAALEDWRTNKGHR